MPIKINGTNTAANPSITGSDTDTGIVYGSDQIDFSTGGSSKVTLNGSNLGIGTTSPSDNLEIAANHSQLRLTDTDDSKFCQFSYSGGKLITRNNSTNTTTAQFTLDESGQMGIGTTSPSHKFHIKDSSANPLLMVERGSGATSFIEAQTDKGVFGTGNNHPVYFLQNSGTAMVIDTSKNIILTSNTTSKGNIDNGSSSGAYFNSAGQLNTSRSTTSNSVHCNFNNPNNTVGTITTNGTSTGFNTSSDYRLKENAVAISDGITRLKTLKPSRFNFLDTKDITVDGFIAHEVTAVPEAISGTKDEVDSDNNPVYQGIDQRKLVPLLTAALQEAVGKIEVLETKVAALEAA